MVYPDLGVDNTYRLEGSPLWSFSRAPLDDVDPLLVDSLLQLLPGGLEDYPLAAFGQPDAGDWGALPLVVVYQGGARRSYLLDNAVRNMDPELQDYGRLMRRAIRAWSQ